MTFAYVFYDYNYLFAIYDKMTLKKNEKTPT